MFLDSSEWRQKSEIRQGTLFDWLIKVKFSLSHKTVILSLSKSWVFQDLNSFFFPPFPSMDIKTLLDNLHDEVSCSVCICTFTDPKQLPCLHSFCLHCLNGIQRTSGFHGKITCPECRRQFQIPGSGNPKKNFLPIFVSTVC